MKSTNNCAHKFNGDSRGGGPARQKKKVEKTMASIKKGATATRGNTD